MNGKFYLDERVVGDDRILERNSRRDDDFTYLGEERTLTIDQFEIDVLLLDGSIKIDDIRIRDFENETTMTEQLSESPEEL